MRNLWILPVLLVASIASAQTATPPALDTAPVDPVRFPPAWYPPAKQPPTVIGPVRGEPYTATLTISVRVRAPNKPEEALETSFVRARDSAGRTSDRAMSLEGKRVLGGDGDGHQVHVQDPVSHCTFAWEAPLPSTGKAFANVDCQPRVVQFGEPDDPILWEPTNGDHEETSHTPEGTVREVSETLPAIQLQGVEAIGERVTDTVTDAAGHVTHRITEMRYSPKLHVMLLVETTTPADEPAGNLIRTTVTDVRLGDPDPSLFYPPAGYALHSAH